MPRHRVAVLLASLLLFASVVAFAQRRTPSAPSRTQSDLRVRVVYENDRPAGQHLEVTLLAPSGTVIGQGFTDDLGQVTFPYLSPGHYKVRVKGVDIESVETGIFEIARNESVHHEFVNVKLKEEAAKRASPGDGRAMVSASELNIPEKARKEFDKGLDAMKDGDLQKALEKFEKATVAYPQYALAYNNIGVIHMQQQRRDQARQAFETATSVDMNCAPAHVNLARMLVEEKRFPEADKTLEKALTIDPGRPEALALAAQTKMMIADHDAALALSQRLHQMEDHKKFAVVHLIAGNAFEAKGMRAEAVSEYKQFLSEAPDSKINPKVKAAIQSLEQGEQARK